ncbi:MAG: hypothetical protein HY319_32870 [Armatimonadetes bacterium]|nr:hypothetical protein [Armatimonadota bacterium]
MAARWLSASGQSTVDLDVTLFVELNELHRATAILLESGCDLDPEAACWQARDRGTFRVRHSGIPIDVFVPDIPLYAAARKRRRKVELEGRSLWIWAPEDLILFKLLYFRRKDEADVEAILSIQGQSVERDYVRGWLIDMVGEGDPRVTFWDALLREIEGQGM